MPFQPNCLTVNSQVEVKGLGLQPGIPISTGYGGMASDHLTPVVMMNYIDKYEMERKGL